MVFWSGLVSLLLRTLRVCPKCKARQRVPKDLDGQSVRCEVCGASIPPIRREDRGDSE